TFFPQYAICMIDMIENKVNSKRKAGIQWNWDSFWHLSGYSILGFSVMIGLRGGRLGDSLPLFLSLSTLLALWYLPFIVMPITQWWNAPGRALLYFLVGFALWGGLVVLNVEALMLVAMFNPMIFTRFSRHWATGIMVFLTATFLPLYLHLYSSENWFAIVLIVLGMLVTAISIGYYFSTFVGFFAARR
ncbi:MAG: hypothetical protein AAGD96_17840, partial [Chloroflexota bacterium]